MRGALSIILVLLIAAIAYGILRFRGRLRRAAEARAAAKIERFDAYREGQLHGEARYVVSRIEAEIERLEGADPPDPKKLARYRELREVLLRTFGPQATAFPVSGPCAQVIEEFRASAGDRDLLYSESGDGRWLHVAADPDLFGWAVRELVRNCVQHGNGWSRIALLAEPVEGAIVLTLRDDGQGLDPTAAARVYGAFTPRAGSPGPGLGLFLVRRIVETAGGTIEARTTPGDGLVHRVRLPQPASGPYNDAG